MHLSGKTCDIFQHPAAYTLVTGTEHVASDTMILNMDQQSPVFLRINSSWHGAKLHLARVPANAWVVLALFVTASIAMAVHTAFFAQDASLNLKLQHGFRNAQLSVWVDRDLSYSAHLSGAARKRLGFIPDSVQGSLAQVIPLSSGKHVVRVRVEPDDGALVEDSTSAEFADHSQRDLSVSVRRNGMSFNWLAKGEAQAAVVSGNGWLGRYAGSLFMTIAGSIISALAGYVLRELPARLQKTSTTEPKA